ncbi:hypothetical protein K491DRAFT_563884, partial [Lophiostoma macrostomum CBS 122681]
PTPLTLLLIVTCIDAAPYGPAHKYQERAESDHAPRNTPTPVPTQIVGLVGGYVLAVLIWGVLLLTVGRTMRRKTENSPRALELELVTARPPIKTPASPQSARSATSWFKKGFKRSNTNDSAIGSPQSPVLNSPSSFDQKVIEADRARAQEEMERLYAAVMEHDKKKESAYVTTDEDGDERIDRRPARIDTSRGHSSNPSSPVKAIYPPGYHNGPPTAPLPTERVRDSSASLRSVLSKKSHTSETSSKSRTRFNMKNLRISGPIQKYPGEIGNDQERTPLSPRFYNPGAPPSPPTSQNTPTTHDEAYEDLDAVQPLPRPAPQRSGSSTHTPTTASAPRSATQSANALPLRGYAEPLKSPDLRTTVLDRRMDKLSMTTPRTGVPYTPYSPYMPFTPVTPVTPHLITKKERKNIKKMEKRIAAGGDAGLVQSPKEIFGDAY